MRVVEDRRFSIELLASIHHEIQNPVIRNYQPNIFHQVPNGQNTGYGGILDDKALILFISFEFHSSNMLNNCYSF